MIETSATDAPKTEQTDAPKEKISLLEMILFLEDEIGDIDIWERMLHREGSPLYSKMARRRQVLRQALATLELVKTHQTEFVAMIKRAHAAAVAAMPKSAARLSEKSTTENPEPASMEP